MERKVPKDEYHKIRERKVKTLTEIDEITVGQAHKNTWKLNQNILTGMAVFINQKRANVCEHTIKMASLEFMKGATRGFITLATPWWHLS